MTRWTPLRCLLVACPLLAVVAVAAVAAVSVAGGSLPFSSPAVSSPATAASTVDAPPGADPGALDGTPPGSVWPADGQAAFVQTWRSQVHDGQPKIHAGPGQHPAPIASLAKVMTAYLVLSDRPLQPGQDGPTITLTRADVADTDRRRGQQESVVSVAAGERLTELQALQALLLPSANNIAAVLARWDVGSQDRFVDRMNAIARSLGMTSTHYTDPSGYDEATVSTAADQVRIVERAMSLPVFASIVATRNATLPVAGAVHNTDTLLGRDGFVGVKTGSDGAAGGCFAFRAIRWIDGRQATITGVVLGQPGRDLIAAALTAADAMVDRIASAGPTARTTPAAQTASAYGSRSRRYLRVPIVGISNPAYAPATSPGLDWRRPDHRRAQGRSSDRQQKRASDG